MWIVYFSVWKISQYYVKNEHYLFLVAYASEDALRYKKIPSGSIF